MPASETLALLSSLARRVVERAPPLWRKLSRAEPYFYLAFAAACTLWVGCLFNSSIRLQTLYSGLWNNPDSLALKVQHGVTGGEWSAPLDDVFIHFDFARATAIRAEARACSTRSRSPSVIASAFAGSN